MKAIGSFSARETGGLRVHVSLQCGIDSARAPTKERARSATDRAFELLRAPAIRACQAERAAVDIDRSVHQPVAALAAALGLPYFRAAAIGACDRRIPGEQKTLIQRPADSAKTRFRILRPSADRAWTGLRQHAQRRLLRMGSGKSAVSASLRSGSLYSAAVGTDEHSLRRNGHELAGGERREPLFALRGRHVVMQA